MPTPLRAFLIVRSHGGDGEVTVYHALEDLVRAWEERTDDTAAALLHIGFERRPARLYAEAMNLFPGRLLLTEAARAALPTTFRCSSRPVTEVEAAPIYLALEGWGYSEPDPVQVPRSPELSNLSDWVAAFALHHPERIDDLSTAGIHNEQSYLEFESSLDRELRTLLGEFRFGAILAGVESDPIAFVQAAPPWLSDREVSELPLTVRLGNVFRHRGIARVADLAELTLVQLLQLPNFGRTSSHHLINILRDALQAGPPEPPETMAAMCAITLLASVEQSLATLGPREGEVLRRRMGLSCDPQTLAEIGEVYGVSRERIRQIEEKTIQRLIRDEIWDDVLTAKLTTLLTDRQFPIPLRGIEALDPWFEGVSAEQHAIRYLLENMCPSGVGLVEVDGVEYVSFLSQGEWAAALDEARQLLTAGADEHWPRTRCEYILRSLLSEKGTEFCGLLWEVAARSCHFAGEDDNKMLVGHGRGAEQFVEAILHEAADPLHYSEIARLASTRAGREIDERRAHSAAAEIGFLFGPGTYGLLKHVQVPGDQLEAMADEASEIVIDGPPGRQWHTSELIDVLRQRGNSASAAGKHVLDIALKQQGQLTPLGRMIWSSPKGDVDTLRVEVRQALIAILRKAGRPLTTGELRQRLVAVRGLNESMQLSASDPIIKLENGLWGLNDRDLAIKRDDQPALLDTILHKLAGLRRSVHISEISTLLDDRVSGRTLISLAQSDLRFKVDPGSFLSLR